MIGNKTCLVVIYNHKFEKNIQIIKKIYGGRFSKVIQLIPFYDGNDPDVFRVFGNSFKFHTFIAQKRRDLLSVDCDRFLFIGDDLLLNPRIQDDTIENLMKLSKNVCFFPELHDVSKGGFVRGTIEAARLKFPCPGLDTSVLQIIPSFEEAFSILHKKGLMQTRRLTRIKPYFPLFLQPWHKNWRGNTSVLRARFWHFCNMLKYRFGIFSAGYPVVFGYSDIFSIPKLYFDDFCDYLEVFASMEMFVELAIPTTFALHDWNLALEKDLILQPLNVWFPQNPYLFKAKAARIASFEAKANWKVRAIDSEFPKDLLYMHPIKLSRWS